MVSICRTEPSAASLPGSLGASPDGRERLAGNRRGPLAGLRPRGAGSSAGTGFWTGTEEGLPGTRHQRAGPTERAVPPMVRRHARRSSVPDNVPAAGLPVGTADLSCISQPGTPTAVVTFRDECARGVDWPIRNNHALRASRGFPAARCTPRTQSKAQSRRPVQGAHTQKTARLMVSAPDRAAATAWRAETVSPRHRGRRSLGRPRPGRRRKPPGSRSGPPAFCGQAGAPSFRPDPSPSQGGPCGGPRPRTGGPCHGTERPRGRGFAMVGRGAAPQARRVAPPST